MHSSMTFTAALAMFTPDGVQLATVSCGCGPSVLSSCPSSCRRVGSPESDGWYPVQSPPSASRGRYDGRGISRPSAENWTSARGATGSSLPGAAIAAVMASTSLGSSRPSRPMWTGRKELSCRFRWAGMPRSPLAISASFRPELDSGTAAAGAGPSPEGSSADATLVPVTTALAMCRSRRIAAPTSRSHAVCAAFHASAIKTMP